MRQLDWEGHRSGYLVRAVGGAKYNLHSAVVDYSGCGVFILREYPLYSK